MRCCLRRVTSSLRLPSRVSVSGGGATTRRACILAAVNALIFGAGVAVRAGNTAGTVVHVTAPSFALQNIDPAGDFPLATFFQAVCEPLFGYPSANPPRGYTLVPIGAASYPKVSSDGKTYTFTVRRGLRFADGSRITAANYAYAINRILDPRQQSSDAASLLDIVGARAVQSGKATTASGIRARGRTLIIRLTRALGDFPAEAGTCPVPIGLPVDPEGVGAPFSGGGPYAITRWVRGEELVLRRNRFYGGIRPHHISVFDISATSPDEDVIGDVDRGAVDLPLQRPLPLSLDQLEQRYGVNKRRLFMRAGLTMWYLALNSDRPLFRDNAPLRRAINFAVDRRAIAAEASASGADPFDHYIPAAVPGSRRARIYPFHPNISLARRLAVGHRRGASAVLYTRDAPQFVAQADIIRTNLRRIGLAVDVKRLSPAIYIQRIETRGEPFDIAIFGQAPAAVDPYQFLSLVDGRSIAPVESQNISYFDSPPYNHLLARAEALPIGPARWQTFGALDVKIARTAAPMAALYDQPRWVLVSGRLGCVTLNGYEAIDLSALCLRR